MLQLSFGLTLGYESEMRALLFELFFKKIYRQRLNTNLIITNNYNSTKNIFYWI